MERRSNVAALAPGVPSLSTKRSFPRQMQRRQALSLATSVKTISLKPMSTITAILEPHADGSLHLPLPAELRHRRVRVEATLEAADESESAPRLATPEMLGRRREALAALRALGGLKDVIPDPAAWQREQREDRPLPGRE